MVGGELLLGLTAGVVFAGAYERLRHQRCLDQIPIRVHVNGTRGKSSVTRLIAAALREGGIRTCAKTTGTLARMIMPDSHEVPVFRPSRPNVIEQIRIVRAAAVLGAEALVIECMAVTPELQWVSESRLVQATHGIITNARADHLDQMGPTEHDVALALCATVPLRGRLYTAERRHLETVRMATLDRSATLITVDEAEVTQLPRGAMDGFRHTEHPENVALALRVVLDLGIAPEIALRGMHFAAPDPGAMTRHEVEFFGRKIHFFNGFAANDPESTERIWRMALDAFPEVGRRIAIFNCRADRAHRSATLGEAYARWPQADAVVLMGTGTYHFAQAAIRAGVDPTRFEFADERATAEVFELLVARTGRDALVMGMGNIGGPGFELVSFMRNRERLLEA